MTDKNLKIMEFVKKYKWIVMGVIILLLVAGAFWWFEWRPMQIKKNCFKITGGIENVYEWCLRGKGL